MKKTPAGHRGPSSVQSTNTGWFPAEIPYADRFTDREKAITASERLARDAKTKQHERSWHDGVLLSELIAVLLVEDKNLVKQVEHFDNFGRLVSPPKLLLVGSEHAVRSKAQALHNLGLCLQALRGVPNFPVIDLTSEDLYQSEDNILELLGIIQRAFGLPKFGLDVHPVDISKYRKFLAHRQGRSFSAPPALRNANQHIKRQDIDKENRQRDGNREVRASYTDRTYYRHLKLPPRWRSPEPEVRRTAPEPSVLPSRRQMRDSHHFGDNYNAHRERNNESDKYAVPAKHRSRSYSPPRRRSSRSSNAFADLANNNSSFHNSVANEDMNQSVLLKAGFKGAIEHKKELPAHVKKALLVRQLEMRRERLDVQRRDRSLRRRSVLPQKIESFEETEKRISAKSNTSSKGPGGSQRSGSVQSTPASVQQPADNNPNKMVDQAKSSSSRINSDRFDQLGLKFSIKNSRSQLVWNPPKPDKLEVEAAQKVPLVPITIPQQVTIRDWMLSLGLSILDGEGGFHKNYDIRLEGAVNNSYVAALESMPVLPLQHDRLRNGELFTLLLYKLEPDACTHAKLLQLLYKAPDTMAKAMENLERVMWIFKMRKCPPLPPHLLLQPELIVQGNKDLLWGLLWEIMQTYWRESPGESLYHSTTSFGNLKPLPINHLYYRGLPQGGSVSTLNPNQKPSVSVKTLPYTPEQRRSLDQSLLDWFDECGVLRHIMGALGRPPTILALESYLKDGTLFCMLAEEVIGIKLGQAFIRQPHTYAQCVANVIKCVEALRLCRGMTTRYLYSGIEADIARGYWDGILGLLEDMHLFYDRIRDYFQSPQNTGKSQIQIEAIMFNRAEFQYPYLGLKSIRRKEGSGQILQENKDHSDQVNWGVNLAFNQVRLDTMNPVMESTLSTSAEHVEKQSDSKPTQGVSLNEGNARFAVKGEFRPSLDLTHSANIENGFQNKPTEHGVQRELVPSNWLKDKEFALARPANRTSNYLTAVEMTSRDPAMHFIGMHDDVLHDIRSSPYSPNPIETLDQTLSLSEALSIQDSESDEENFNDSLMPKPLINSPRTSSKKADKPSISVVRFDGDQTIGSKMTRSKPRFVSSTDDSLLERIDVEKHAKTNSNLDNALSWLNELGFRLQVDSDLDANAALAQFGSFFVDGVLLGRFAQKLERKSILGFELKPKHAAQRMQNVRRTLEFFAEHNKRLSLRNLSCEEKILEGDGEAILKLLENVRKAYPHHKA